MKAIAATVSILAFSMTGAMAAGSDAPLAPGRPAGAHQADLSGGQGMLIVAGAAAIGFAVVLATAGSGPGVTPVTPPATTTSSTGP